MNTQNVAGRTITRQGKVTKAGQLMCYRKSKHSDAVLFASVNAKVVIRPPPTFAE